MSGPGGTNSAEGGLGAQHLARAASIDFDLIVVGGGITGAWATAMAAAAGHKVCLVEAGDFGGETSRVSHRILHGGFRYLQSGDVSRLREAVRERREWFRCFPDLVRPLPCLMPLYGRGLKRPLPFKAATVGYAALAADRNRGVRQDLRLSAGSVLSRARTSELFPLVRPEGLQGGGVWADGVMRSHPRLILSLLRYAASCGAVCLNHTPAVGIDPARDGGIGVRVRPSDGSEITLRGTRALNTTSVWASAWDERLRVHGQPIVPRAMAFNLVLDLEPVSAHGVAVEPPEPGPDGERRVYFLVPRHGRIAAGTTHLPVSQDEARAAVTWAMVDRMLADLNASVPGLNAERRHVIRVDAGLLPSEAAGGAEPSERPTVVDHRDSVGRGVVSAVAVKYTTARRTAMTGLGRVFEGVGRPIGEASSMSSMRQGLAACRPEPPLELLLNPAPSMEEINAHRESILSLCEAEGVGSLADLVLGRTEWGEDPSHAARLAGPLAELLGSRYAWDEQRKRFEVESLAHALPGSLPKMGMELTTSGEDSAP